MLRQTSNYCCGWALQREREEERSAMEEEPIGRGDQMRGRRHRRTLVVAVVEASPYTVRW
jgi:hypothetical protein